MIIIDRSNDSVIHLSGDWHFTIFEEKTLWLFPGSSVNDHYEFKLDYDKETIFNKFSMNITRFNLNKDVEVIM